MRIRTGRVEAAMEERDEMHVCKICDRTFKCGRALGGHMRSHLTTLKLPLEPPKKQHHREEEEEVVKQEGEKEKRMQREEKYDEDEDEEDEEEEEQGIVKEEIEENFVYSLRENPRKSFRLSDPEFSFTIDASSYAAAAAAALPAPIAPPPVAGATTTTTVHDSQSDTEELYRPSRRKAHHHRFALGAGCGDASAEEPASSISETSPEEDVAISLMLLSRDLRPPPDSSIAASSSPAPKRRRKFQCGTCRKIFPSYQALGGHRAGHKKSKGSCAPAGMDVLPDLSGDGKIHECPVCFRVFGSGQALGGHKRTHVLGAGIGIPLHEREDSILDLNLPAAVDDSTSAVSDAEFTDPEKTN